MDLSMRGLKPGSRFLWELPSGPVRPLQHLPVITVACPVLQLSFEADRRPVRPGRRSAYFCRGFPLARARRPSLDDRPELIGVDAPGAGVAELSRCGPPPPGEPPRCP